MTAKPGVRRWVTPAGLVVGAGVAAAVVGMGVADADDSTIDFNGWSLEVSQPITPGPLGSGVSSATLLDPSDSLGMGNPVAGQFLSLFSGSAEQFQTPPLPGHPDGFHIDDVRFGPFELVSVGTAGDDNGGIFVQTVGGKEVVDLLNFHAGSGSYPLVNPDATGPVYVGGLELASPQDGALLNDVFDAIFTGDTADWGKAETLFDDLLGIGPSSATDAVDPSSFIG